MSEVRIDRWVKTPDSAEQLVDYLGRHLVAYPYGQAQFKAGGQFIGMDPAAQTVSLRRYDNGQVREFPWNTTDFRFTTFIESPFTELKVGCVRRFEWFHGPDGTPVDTPITLVGTVDQVKPEQVQLWVRDATYDTGGWWAAIKAEEVDRHALRPTNLKQDRE
ncbi:hypothetical protein ACWEDZ_02810 [Streptomyces sp. NPDC005047]